MQAKPEPKAKKAFDYFPYFAYSPNGTVEGELVFIKAGSEDDINLLLNRTNVSLTNKIVIARGIYARVSTRKLYFKQAVMVHDPMWLNDTSNKKIYTFQKGNYFLFFPFWNK